MAKNTPSPLMLAASAVHEARGTLATLDSRLAELREKSQEIAELRGRLDSAQERRAEILESAMLYRRAADTASIDKEIVAAERAVERRKDEATAVSRALETLEQERQAAQAALSGLEAVYRGCRDERTREIGRAAWLAKEFHKAILAASKCLREMPSEAFRDRLGGVAAKLLEQGNSGLAEDALEALVTSEAQADLAKADEHASLRTAPECVECGYVWSDNTVHEEPEPAPTEPPVTVYQPGKIAELPPGMPGARRV